jgi:hypothetical protein
MISDVPRVAGLHRAGQRQGCCGLCGQERDLTRTHIPPQCAFNGRTVRRQYLRGDGEAMSPGRGNLGGLWVRGLCGDCNELQGRYDPDYCKLARKLKSTWIKDWHYALPRQRLVPQIFDLHPGAVARSVLIGMFGLNPNLRKRQPALAEALLLSTPFEMPTSKKLRLALFRGQYARISGGIGAFDALNSAGLAKPVGVMSDAQVYFPPLSWELEDAGTRDAHAPDFGSLTDAYGWADVSDWTHFPPAEPRDLHSFFLTLPAVAHPKDMPGLGEGWVELMSDEISEILIADLGASKPR